MQATVLRDSELWHAEALSGLANNRLASFGKKLKGKERATALPNADSTSVNGRTDKETATAAIRISHTADSDQTASSSGSAPADARESATQPGPSQSTRSSKVKAEKYQHSHRKDREKDKDRDKEKSRAHRHRSHPVPILADARAECILVAARKLGRVRAGVISGFVKECHKPEAAVACPQTVKDHAEERRAEAASIIETRPSRDGEDPPSSPAIPLAQTTGSSRAQSQRPAAVPHPPPSPAAHSSPRKLAPTPSPSAFSAPAASHQIGRAHV